MARPIVLVVLGTRPEVIKLAPVIHALAERRDLVVRLCVTAQHRQMLDQMLRNFRLKPDFDLDLMQRDQDLNAFSARALPALQEVIRGVRPRFLLVQGDTTTAFIAALAAFYERVPVGHVEAGLRSFDRFNPYPEEMNRLLIARLSALHFAPTAIARANLLAEGVPPDAIIQTGNTIVDALQWCAAHRPERQSPVLRQALAALGPRHKAVLATTHRRENLGRPLESLCGAFKKLLEKYRELHLFYPVHMNPRVRSTVGRLMRHPRAHLLPTLDYFDLIHLLRRCHFVLTDSGGLQEEAPSLGKPVIILRKVTERPEAVDAGVARLAGTDPAAIIEIASQLMDDQGFHGSMARGTGIYGDGRASLRIVESLRHAFGLAHCRADDYRQAQP
ncbi:MAG: UDP-N-acetylglucosamine 2-epimerase (non-hydrolyzing) [Elusimicrobia bacterium]|nr:UDP-N-acetylglucosamine 2-epimerase (non-hydrolyzing) [Elusimicrobiota bacterium]